MPDTPPLTDGWSTLADGCPHALCMLSPDLGFFDMYCARCEGILHAPWAAKWAGAGFDTIGGNLAREVGGTYHGNATHDPRPATAFDNVLDDAPRGFGPGRPIHPDTPAAAALRAARPLPEVGQLVYPTEDSCATTWAPHLVLAVRAEPGETEWLWLLSTEHPEHGPQSLWAGAWTTRTPTPEQQAARQELRDRLLQECSRRESDPDDPERLTPRRARHRIG